MLANLKLSGQSYPAAAASMLLTNSLLRGLIVLQIYNFSWRISIPPHGRAVVKSFKSHSPDDIDSGNDVVLSFRARTLRGSHTMVTTQIFDTWPLPDLIQVWHYSVLVLLVLTFWY